MKFTFAHNNLNVLNLEKSLAFYKEALGLVEVRRKEKPDFTLVFLGDEVTPHKLELTWLKDRTEAEALIGEANELIAKANKEEEEITKLVEDKL